MGIQWKSFLIGAVTVIAVIKVAPRVPMLQGIASKIS